MAGDRPYARGEAMHLGDDTFITMRLLPVEDAPSLRQC